MATTAMLITVRIHSSEGSCALRHFVAARQRGGRRLLDQLRDLSFDTRKRRRGHAFFLEVLLVEADRVALAPCGKQIGRKRFARLALIVRRMTAHPKRFSNEQCWALAGAAARRRDPRRGVGVEHIVAVESCSPDPVARRPIAEVGREMLLIETRSQRHLTVLADKNRGAAF